MELIQCIIVLLSEIQDIVYGPSTKNFIRAIKRYEKSEISYACCFSIITAKRTIDIQANSDKEVLSRFWAILNVFVVRYGNGFKAFSTCCRREKSQYRQCLQ